MVIFNTVINTLINTLQTRLDLGYTLSDSTRQVNVLQYADDTCLLADSPAAAQHLLGMVGGVAHWSVMTFAVRSVYRDCRVWQNLGGAW